MGWPWGPVTIQKAIAPAAAGAPLFSNHAKEKRGPCLRRDDGNKVR